MLIFFLPKINEFLRIHFIQKEFEQINALSQIQWLGTLLEIFKAFLIVPIFYQLSRKENPKKLFYFTLCFVIFVVFPCVFFVPMIETILHHTQKAFSDFLIFQWLNGCLEIIFSFFVTFLLCYERTKALIVLILFQFFIALGIDFFLLSKNISIYIVNISTACSYGLVVLCFWLFVFRKIKIHPSSRILSLQNRLKDFLKLHFLPAIEQLLDNLGYIFVILASLNLLQENMDYFLVMSYFWGFLLVPVLAFGEISKKVISTSQKPLKLKLYFIFCVNGFFAFLLSLSYFFTANIASFLGLHLSEDAFLIIYKLYPCYIVFIFAYAIKCIFYAKGLFYHSFLVSLAVNLLIYLPVYLWCEPSLDFIILVFSCGIYLNFFLFLLLFFIFLKANYARKSRFFKRANHHLFGQ